MRLPEDKQKAFLEKKMMKDGMDTDVVRGDKIADQDKGRFHCLDKNLQDMLRSKNLAHMVLFTSSFICFQ